MYEINVKFQSKLTWNKHGAFVPHGFLIVASSILIVFDILLENDDVFKLLIYLDMYIFSCVSIMVTRSVEASLLIT